MAIAMLSAVLKTMSICWLIESEANWMRLIRDALTDRSPLNRNRAARREAIGDRQKLKECARSEERRIIAADVADGYRRRGTGFNGNGEWKIIGYCRVRIGTHCKINNRRYSLFAGNGITPQTPRMV